MTRKALEFAFKTASREAILAHLTACNACFDRPLDERVDLVAYAGKISDKAVTFEAWSAGVLAGLVAAYLNDDAERIGYITNVSVTKGFMGRGVAKTLMRHCLEEARRRQLMAVVLEVGKRNVPAIALYRGLGFKEYNVQVDSILMRVTLLGP